jgi:hypothetical protein
MPDQSGIFVSERLQSDWQLHFAQVVLRLRALERQLCCVHRNYFKTIVMHSW